VKTVCTTACVQLALIIIVDVIVLPRQVLESDPMVVVNVLLLSLYVADKAIVVIELHVT
jgi:hypothetical protein